MMTRLGYNVIIAVLWCLLTGSFAEWNFVGGLLIGVLVIAGYVRVSGGEPYLGAMWRGLMFVCYFTRILVKANLDIAKEVVTPGFSQTPRIVRYPVGHLSAVQVTTLANAITLTPGTLVVDISPDDEWLYIHAMYAQDRQAAIDELSELETRLMKGVFS